MPVWAETMKRDTHWARGTPEAFGSFEDAFPKTKAKPQLQTPQHESVVLKSH